MEELRRPRCSDRVFYNILLTSVASEELLGTARCCSDRAFYNIFLTYPGLGGAPGRPLNAAQTVFFTITILLTFPGLAGAPEDRSMLLRPCFLQYMRNLHGSSRSFPRPLNDAQTVHFTIYYEPFAGLGGAPGDRSMLLGPYILQYISAGLGFLAFRRRQKHSEKPH